MTRSKPPSGTRDFLPVDVARRRHVIGIIREVYERYGFVPLETPAIENLSTLLGKYGEDEDRLIYRLLRRGEALERVLEAGRPSPADLAEEGLRYDLTVPLARFLAQHPELPRFFKRYQIQPVWRADRPGRGRLREFYQCDVDITGTTSLVAEAEVCAAVAEVLLRLGFERFSLRMGHRVLLRALIASSGIAPDLEPTALVAVDKLHKVGPEGVARELQQRGVPPQPALRLIERLTPPSTPLDNAAIAARLRRDLGEPACRQALDDLRRILELVEATPAAGRVQLAPELARGLGYYTGPIFEIAVDDLAGSLGGGGRYDHLVGRFGGRPVPAVGFSLGLERILLVMEERGLYPELRPGSQLVLCSIEVPPPRVLEVAHRLRSQGLTVEVYPEPAKLGRQLQYAAHAGARFAAILGGAELAVDEIVLKHLDSGTQRRAPVADAAAVLAAWPDGGAR
jgi:histidyl-tRNA synthetase